MVEGSDASAGKSKRRIAVKAQVEPSGKKLKATIHLSREADIRLNIHCTMMGIDRSAMIEKLINDHLRRYVVSDRGGQELTGAETAA